MNAIKNQDLDVCELNTIFLRKAKQLKLSRDAVIGKFIFNVTSHLRCFWIGRWPDNLEGQIKYVTHETIAVIRFWLTVGGSIRTCRYNRVPKEVKHRNLILVIY